MIYFNKEPKHETKEMSFGTLSGISIGEEGRGRWSIFLPLPGADDKLKEGMNEEYTIGYSKSGKPRINKSHSEEIYLVLSSQAGYTRRGDGTIYAPVDQDVEIIARGYGADGAAGRIGTWDAIIVKAKENDVFRVKWSGSGYGIEPEYYVVHNNNVYHSKLNEIEELYDSIGKEPPFSLRYEEGVMKINTDEWDNIASRAARQKQQEEKEQYIVNALEKEGYTLTGESNYEKIDSGYQQLLEEYRNKNTDIAKVEDFLIRKLGYEWGSLLYEEINKHEERQRK